VPWVKEDRGCASSPPMCQNWGATDSLYLFYLFFIFWDVTFWPFFRVFRSTVDLHVTDRHSPLHWTYLNLRQLSTATMVLHSLPLLQTSALFLRQSRVFTVPGAPELHVTRSQYADWIGPASNQSSAGLWSFQSRVTAKIKRPLTSDQWRRVCLLCDGRVLNNCGWAVKLRVQH
jgi:hypothetical protein